MKLALDVEVKVNEKGEIELLSQNVKKLDEASGRAGRGGLKVFEGGLSGIAKALAGAGIVAGLTALTKSAINAGDELWTMSERTGLTVETLSTLKYHGEQAGTSIDSITRSMNLANRAAIEAVNGNEQSAKAFQKLGISVAELKRLSPEELFEKIAQGIGKTTDPVLRSVLAQQTLGRSSAELIPLLNQLAEEGFDGMRESAEDAGVVMSTDTAQAADTLNDSIQTLKAQSTVALAEVAKAAIGLGEAFSADLPKGLVASMNPLNLVSLAAKGLSALFVALINNVKSAAAVIGGLLDGLAAAFAKLNQPVMDIRGAWNALKIGVGAGISEADAIGRRTVKHWQNVFDPEGPGASSKAPPGVDTDRGGLGNRNRDAERAAKERQRAFEAGIREREKMGELEEQRIERSKELLAVSTAELAILEAQEKAADALNESEAARARHAARVLEIEEKTRAEREKLSQQLKNNEITVEAFDAADYAAEMRGLNAQADSWREYQRDLTEIQQAESDKRLEIEAENLEKWQKKVDEFGGHLKDSFRDALSIALNGGGTQEIIGAFFDNLLSRSQEMLSKWAESWIDTFSSWAQGETAQEGPMKGVAPTKGQQAGAKWGMAGLQAAGALYGMYQNRNQSTDAQMAMQGAMAGAQIGGMIMPGWGHLIGAVIGGIVGVFVGGAEGKNVRINSKPGGGFTVSGLGGEGEWGIEKALRALDAAVSDTAAVMDDILLGIPASILNRLEVTRPDLTKLNISGKADGKNWTEELENFIRHTVPQAVMEAYEPILRGVFDIAGVTTKRVDELFARAGKLDAGKAQELIKSYVNTLFGLQDAIDFLSLSADERTSRAVRVSAGSPVDRIAEIDERIGRLGENFFALPLEQQIKRGEQIVALTNERYQIEIAYLNQIASISKAISESVERQIFEIAQTQRTPTEQIDALMGRQRDLFTRLGQASTPEEIQQIMAEIQQNAGALFDMMGRTPEAARQITEMLTGANDIAQRQLDLLRQAAQEAADLMKDTLTAILDFLKGLEAEGIVPVGTTPGGTNPVGGAPPGDVAPINDFSTATIAASASVGTFGTALESWATRIGAINPPGPVQVVVNIDGNLDGIVQRVSAVVVPQATNATIQRISASNSRNSLL